MEIIMPDGFEMKCWPGGGEFWAPRKLEGKVYGLAGNQHYSRFYNHGGITNPHSRNSAQATIHWDAGVNKKNIEFMNSQFNEAKMSGKKRHDNQIHSADQVSSYDLKPTVPGEPIPGLVTPMDLPWHHDGRAGNNCRQGWQYPYPASPYNGNRPWKGIAKAFVSWRVDDDEIPSIFGGVREKRTSSNTRWHELTPAFGVNKNAPNGAKALAKKACASLVNFAKAYKSCIFDFMAMGKMGTDKNIEDKNEQQMGDSTKAKIYSVRDASGNNGKSRWVNRPSWGCVDEFAAHLTAAAKKHFAAAHHAKQKDAMCKCQHTYLGVCAYDHFICIADIKLT